MLLSFHKHNTGMSPSKAELVICKQIQTDISPNEKQKSPESYQDKINENKIPLLMITTGQEKILEVGNYSQPLNIFLLMNEQFIMSKNLLVTDKNL